jgi:thiol:disulfide interchange protein DsbD
VALLFALIGGLLLNLMPCVFPILSIKILGIVEHGGADRKRIRNHGLAFAAGVVAAFWALAAALLIIRAGGTQLGWGFQLQSPYFVAFLAGLFFLIGLNLMGVFQVGLALTRLGGHLNEPSGYAGSVIGGVLATIVATPCIAPFMGAALGFALTQTAFTTLLVFGFLGIGMALPYLVLSMAPILVQRLPRPGPWMETTRQVLAFPLFATAVWLVWVFGRQTGVDGVTYLVLGLLLLGYAVWIVGRWNRLIVSRRTYFATRSVAIAAVAAAVALTVKGTRGPQGPADVDGMWEQWSTAAVASHRSAGRPVFVDFTADWCLTCKVNERVVLANAEIESAFEERDVALLEADWTRRDPAITSALESFGVGGVPLYVLYPPDPSNAPRVLPVILTKRIVLKALEEITARQEF